MSYDTPWTRPLPMITDLKTALISLLEEITPWQDSDQRVSKRGSKGKMSVMLLCLAVLHCLLRGWVLLAQLLHTLQVQTAVEMGVDTFDVSLELLIRYLPDLQQVANRFAIPLTEVIQKMGPGLGLIRPHTRRKMQVPEIGWWEILTPPPDLQWIRTPRYPHKKAGNANRKSSS